ncbi:MAG: 30S ribosomal protein S20 [Patescibacteria group bacterium]
MPITTSAKKALRQSERRHTQNLKRKTAYKDALRTVRRAVAAGQTDAARAALPPLYQALDKAAKIGVIKKNKASRIKSRATRRLSAPARPA